MRLLECDFFWNSQNIANLVFRFEDAAPDTQQTDQTMDQDHGQRKRRTRNRSEMLTWTT